MSLITNPEYEALLPKLPKQEYGALKDSIRKVGLHYPIVTNTENVILDGHHRYKACQELGIDPKSEARIFSSNLLEKKFVIESNLRRRHLNDFQRAELAYPLEEIEAELARQRQEASIPERGQQGFQSVSCSNEHHIGKARDLAAAKVGLSPTTYQRSKKIIEEASDELKDKVRNGAVSINYAYEMLREKTETPPLPEGSFNVIYADPPWQYDFRLRGSPDMHYSTVPIDELKALALNIAEDAVLFLWATNPKLEQALEVMRAWGFSYKTNIVWVKNHFGTGYYVRGQHELLLIGKKGNMPVPKECDRPSSVFKATRTQHSRKPKGIYDLIEKMYPDGYYLELYATQKRNHWKSWGASIGS